MPPAKHGKETTVKATTIAYDALRNILRDHFTPGERGERESYEGVELRKMLVFLGSGMTVHPPPLPPLLV